MNPTAKKIGGKLKQMEGRLTGDKARQAQGKVDEGIGKVGAKVKSGVRRAKAKLASTKVGRKAMAAKETP